MRNLEVLILAALLPLIIGLALRPTSHRRWLRPWAWITLALALLQLVIEGYRWQMIPAYALAVSACIRCRYAADQPVPDSRRGKVVRLVGGAAGVIAWAATLVLAVGNPIFEDPKPTGPYSVGTARLYFSDASRLDPFAPRPGTPRELLVVVWYPADATTALPLEPFWPDAPASGPILAKVLHLPAFNFAQHLRLVQSRSHPNAPVARAPARYPVLIFSHGYASTPWQNTVQMEELASNGFVVFSVGHTYESAAIPFPDGRIAFINKARAEESARDRAVLKEFVAQSLDVWVEDIRYVLDELAQIDAEPHTSFGQRLDLTRVGVFGMSFGGAAAGEFCARDSRCKAGINIDGFQFGALGEHPLTVPFLYFAAGEGSHENDETYAGSRGDFYSVQVRNAKHANFSDITLILPILRYVGTLGSIDSQEMERILNAYTLAFFENYLQGRRSRLLEGPPPAGQYSEVIFKARKAAATVQ